MRRVVTERSTFDEFFAGCERSVVHLEMRDIRTPGDPTPVDRKAGVEYETTPLLDVPAGERFRWIDRRSASCPVSPDNDFRVFDDRLMRFGRFSGDGIHLGRGPRAVPAKVRSCSSALETVWEPAIDREDHRPK